MKPKEYRVLSEAVEAGVNYGYRRAYKYTDAPSEDHFKNEVSQAVVTEICEWFSFDDEARDEEPLTDGCGCCDTKSVTRAEFEELAQELKDMMNAEPPAPRPLSPVLAPFFNMEFQPKPRQLEFDFHPNDPTFAF